MRKLALGVVLLLLAGVVIAVSWTTSPRARVASTPKEEQARAVETSNVAPTHALERPPVEQAPKSWSQSPARVEHPTSANEPEESSATERSGAEQRFRVHLWGTVRDRSSLRPVPEVQLRFRCGAQTLAQPRTLANGRFEADFEAFGACRVEVTPPEGWIVVDGAGTLGADVLDGSRALEIHVSKERGEVAGDIHGYLLSESGDWTRETLPKDRAVLVDLVPTREPRTGVRGEITPVIDTEGRATLEFAFRDVAPGEYELTISALDGFRWAPQSLRVSPPADGLSFVRYDKDRTLPLVFEVFDAQTREAITAFKAYSVKITPSLENGVFFHSGPIELGTYSIHDAFQWAVAADGYASAFGDQSAFTNSADKRVAQVFLARGWSTRVLALARDPAAHLAVNAEVYVDGGFAGRTGADGTFLLRANAEPKSIEVRYAGFRPGGSTRTTLDPWNAARHAHTTIVYLERER